MRAAANAASTMGCLVSTLGSHPRQIRIRLRGKYPHPRYNRVIPAERYSNKSTELRDPQQGSGPASQAGHGAGWSRGGSKKFQSSNTGRPVEFVVFTGGHTCPVSSQFSKEPRAKRTAIRRTHKASIRNYHWRTFFDPHGVSRLRVHSS